MSGTPAVPGGTWRVTTNIGTTVVTMSNVDNRNVPANDLTAEELNKLPGWDPASTKPRKRRRWTWALLGFLFGLGFAQLALPGLMGMLASLSPPPAPPAGTEVAVATPPVEPPPPPAVLSNIEVTTVAPQDLREIIRVTGSVRPDRETRLSANVSATIETITVNEGQAVAAGDILLEFDADELNDRLEDQQSSLANARVQLETSEANLERTRTLVTRNVATQATLDTAQAQVSQAEAAVATLEAQVRAAERALGDATVRAPYAGVVATRDVSEGESVSIGTPLLTVVDLANVEVEAMIPTMVIASVRVGQPAAIAITGIPGRIFDAEVERISPTASSGAHSIPVYLNLDNSDGALRGGMFATGTIELATKAGAIAFPPTAIRRDDAGAYVLKILDGELVRQPVTVGDSWNEGALVEVTDGIAVGDRVVVAPLPNLEAGAPVTIEGA